MMLCLVWCSVQSHGVAAAGADAQPETLWYDSGHRYVTERLQRAAIWFDGFFGDPRIDADSDANAYLHVVLETFQSGVEDASETGVRFRGGVDLPQLDQRLRLLLTSDADSLLTGREFAGTEQDELRDGERGIGLRYLFRDRPNSRFSLGAGLSGGLSPELSLRARHRYTQDWTKRSRSHLTTTLYWKSADGSGISTLLDYEWLSNADTLWRYTLFGNVSEETRELEWSTQAKWARRLNDKSAINIRGGIQGDTKPENLLTEGWLKFLYRRNILRSWLFYEIEPGLSWHHQEDYQVEPTIALRLEIQFRE